MKISCHSFTFAALFVSVSLWATPIKVGTLDLNTQKFSDMPENTWNVRRIRFAKYFEQAQYDILAVQDVYNEAQVDLPDLVGPDYHIVFFSPSNQDGSGNNAIGIIYKKSRFALSDFNHFWISDSPDICKFNDELTVGGESVKYKRGACCAIFTDKTSGNKFFFMTLRGATNKKLNAKYSRILIEKEKQYNPEGLPSILAGEVTTGPYFPTNKLLSNYWTDIYTMDIPKTGPEVTVNDFKEDYSKNPAKRKDYIYCRGAVKPLWYVCDTTCVDSLRVSSHFAVYSFAEIGQSGLKGENADKAQLNAAKWNWNSIKGGAQYGTASFQLFNKAQTISILKYKETNYKTNLIDVGGELKSTSYIASRNNVLAAINGTFFSRLRLESDGLVKQDGVIRQTTSSDQIWRIDGIVGLRKGKLFIFPSDADFYNMKIKLFEELMASGPILIRHSKIQVGNSNSINAFRNFRKEMHIDSKEYESYGNSFDNACMAKICSFYDQNHPRSIIGYDKDGYVYMIAINGRESGKSEGMTIYEAAKFCEMLGLKNAINLDGGGSSTLWIEGKGVINKPTDRSGRRIERAVPNAFGITLKSRHTSE